VCGVFHYVPLHSSPMGVNYPCPRPLPVTDSASGRLLRLPLFFSLTYEAQERVIQKVAGYVTAKSAVSASQPSQRL
jgi:dTDP-4-amino-4,6-dideoxygalactose transaminase